MFPPRAPSSLQLIAIVDEPPPGKGRLRRNLFALSRLIARRGYPVAGMERGQLVFEETFVAEEELWREDGADHAGWWCVRTDPFPCPASGCTFIAEFMTAAHLILVWQEQDDPNLLKQAGRARDVGRNPRVVGYRSEFGPSASYYAWLAAGRPVHGVRAH